MRFHFEAFVAYGNVPDIFVDRTYGHNLDPNNADDVSFIHQIGDLNDRLISEGAIKPTQMVAVMRTRSVSRCRSHLHWSPAFCVRTPPPYRSPDSDETRCGDGSAVQVVGPGKLESRSGYWQDGWISDECEIAIRASQVLEAVVVHGYLPESRQHEIEVCFQANAMGRLSQRVTPGLFSVRVPIELSQHEVLRLQIASGDSFRPAHSGDSSDRRKLAAVLREIQLIPRTDRRQGCSSPSAPRAGTAQRFLKQMRDITRRIR